MKGAQPKTASAISSRLRLAGVTAAAVAAAIGLGFGMNELIDYFASGADPNTGAPPGGDYTPPGEVIPDGPDFGPGPSPGPGPGPGPGPSPGGDGYGEERPWWSYTQNLTAKDLRGRGRSDGRSARAAIVRQVMNEHGLTMTQASSYVKQNGLY